MIENAKEMHNEARELLRELADSCMVICDKNKFNNADFSAFLLGQLLTSVVIVTERLGTLDRFLETLAETTAHYMSGRGMDIKIGVLKKSEGGPENQ